MLGRRVASHVRRGMSKGLTQYLLAHVCWHLLHQRVRVTGNEEVPGAAGYSLGVEYPLPIEGMGRGLGSANPHKPDTAADGSGMCCPQPLCHKTKGNQVRFNPGDVLRPSLHGPLEV